MMPGAEIKVLVATKPVDFRLQADTLAALVQEALRENPLLGLDLRVPTETHEQSETLVVGRHRNLSSHEASGKQSVSLARDRGRNDAAHVGTACDAASGAGMAPHAAS
jgi:hypothetical protein